MEKICIVNLRKRIISPVSRPAFENDAEPYPAQARPVAAPKAPASWGKDAGEANGKREFTAAEVSLALTADQVSALKRDPYLISFLRREFSDTPGEAAYRGEPIVIRVAWEPQASARLLISQDVLQMLRISKGCLAEIVRSGRLQSYLVGRRRRFRLDDVLSFLEDNRCTQDHEPPDAAQVPRDARNAARERR